jgi:methylated-DNA-[protein]-cysteine S-methyltransferase
VTLTYDAGAFGVGEVVFRGDVPVHHEGPERLSIPPSDRVPDTAPRRDLLDRLRRYFRGERITFADVDMAPVLEFVGATDFEAACVRQLAGIPYGEVVSYGELARLAGYPGAARAAGSVCARGTLSIIVPYHRVIRSDGALGPYGPDGTATKRRLLALEGVDL